MPLFSALRPALSRSTAARAAASTQRAAAAAAGLPATTLLRPFQTTTQRWAEQAQQQQQPGKQSGQLLVRFATPSETIVNEKPAYMVTVPAVTGVMGILADHAPTIAQMKPGIVQIHTNDLNDITHKYFVSGGFAIVTNESSASITAVEAIKVDDLDLAAAKKGIEDAIALLNRTTDEKQRAEAQIQQEVYEAIVNALEGR